MSSRGTDTRTLLLLAAEKLFAERGIEGVSLRQVNTAAGQKNKSAVHYYFGSKRELVLAIFEHRTANLESRRSKLLDQLEAKGDCSTIRDWVGAIARPMAELIEAGEGGSYIIRFMAQVHSHPGAWIMRETGKKDMVIARIFGGLMRWMSDLPPALVRLRLHSMIGQLLHAMADREHRFAEDNDHSLISDIPFSLFVSNMVDQIAAGLIAPVSSRTVAEFRALEALTAATADDMPPQGPSESAWPDGI